MGRITAGLMDWCPRSDGVSCEQQVRAKPESGTAGGDSGVCKRVWGVGCPAGGSVSWTCGWRAETVGAGTTAARTQPSADMPLSELPGVRSSVGPLLGSAHPPPPTGLAPPLGTSPTVDALSTAAGDSGYVLEHQGPVRPTSTTRIRIQAHQSCPARGQPAVSPRSLSD